MAHIFSTTRPLILDRMARDKEHRRQLLFSTFAKTDNGYWLAWKPNADGRISIVTYLMPDHPKGEPALEIETWGDGLTVAELVDYFESDAIETDPPGVLNLFIEGEDDFPEIPEPPKPEPPPKPPRKPRTVKAYTYDSKTGKETVHKR